MMKNKKIKKKIRKILSVVLISIISIGCWEIGKKQVNYIKSIKEYELAKKEKESAKSISEYLYDKEYEWITITETAIDYPLMTATDNEYYLTHNYKDETDIGGAIYYDALDTPYNNRTTVIYGHSMRNGTMFNNLHYFQKDINRFKKSELTIYNKNEEKTYIPLGFITTSAKDIPIRDIDNMNINDAINYLLDNNAYVLDVPYDENSHILSLVTCDYSVNDGRLIVFYIEK
jgi:sortase B